MPNPFATSRSLGIRILAALAMVWLVFLGHHYFELGTSATSRQPSSDFYKFYLSAQRLNAGHSMYWLVPPRLKKGDPCHPDTPESEAMFPSSVLSPLTLGGELPCLAPNLNPPIFMAVMLPLSTLGYAQAWWMWAGISAICIVLGAWLLTERLIGNGQERLAWTLITCAILFTYYPTIANFSMGQLGALLLPLMVLSWKDLHKGRNYRAGIWLGMAIAIKPFLVVMLLGLVMLRQWRAIAACLLTAGGMTLLGAMLFGVQAYQDYMLVARNVGWTASNWNGSWAGLFDRAFSGQTTSEWPANKPLSQALAAACAMFTLGLELLVIRQLWRRQAGQGTDAAFALGIPTALLISPLGWVYYLPAILLSNVIAWGYTKGHAQSRAMRLALLVPVAMAAVPITLKVVPTPLHPTQWWGVDSWYCYTLQATLAACTLAMLWGQTKKGAEAPSL